MTDATVFSAPTAVSRKSEEKAILETRFSTGGVISENDPASTASMKTSTGSFGIVSLHTARDTVRVTALAHQIKMQDPGNTVVWYTSTRFAHLLENNPYIDQVVILDGSIQDQERRIPEFRLSRRWKKFLITSARTSVVSLPGTQAPGLQSTLIKHPYSDAFRPVMKLTAEEVHEARAFMSALPSGPKILLEGKDDESQSPWDVEHERMLIDRLRHLDPVIVLLSEQPPKNLERLQAIHANTYWFPNPSRQAAELYNQCDAFIGVSSAYSFIVQSDWCRNDIPTIEMARMAEDSTLAYQHQEVRKICVDLDKFAAAIEWIDRILCKHPAAELSADKTFSDVYITRKSGRFEYVSPAIMVVKNDCLESVEAFKQLLTECGPYTFLYGGLGDSLLALSEPLDGDGPITIVASVNSNVALESLLATFPKVERVLFLPKPKRHMLMTTIRFVCVTHEMCRYYGTIPNGTEESSWGPDFDLDSQPGVKMHPDWVRNMQGLRLATRQVVLAPKGSVRGTFRSKRNIINPRFWPTLLKCLEAWNITPVIIGTPEENEYYPSRDFCINKRSYDLAEQMAILRGADCVIAADSWHKTFSAMAGIDTVVFESTVGHDMDLFVDASNYVFITPWKEITFVRRFDHAIKAIASHLGTDYDDVRSIVETMREPIRTTSELPLSLRDKVFTSYSFETAKNVLIRTDEVLRHTLLVTNVVHQLKTMYPHLHVTVSGAEQGLELFHHHPDVDACVRKGSAEEYVAESLADELVEFSSIVDLIAERYLGAHLMDVMSGVAGLPTTDRRIHYTVTESERNEASRILVEKFGTERHLRIGYNGMITDETRRSYNHRNILSELLHSVNPNIDFVNVGTNADVTFPEGVLDCTRLKLPLRLQIALIEQCDIVITADSEFHYIASNLFNKPTILLLGPGNERCSGNEYATNVAVVRNSDRCKSCPGTCRTHCLGTIHPANIIAELAYMIDPSQKTVNAI